jgi:hypothetical protein
MVSPYNYADLRRRIIRLVRPRLSILTRLFRVYIVKILSKILRSTVFLDT